MPAAARDAERLQRRDGCPDPGPEWVRLGQGKIEVDEKLGFVSHGGKVTLRDSSAKVVNDVALVMKGHPDIAKLRIDVAAQGVSKAETQKRADALRDFLVSKGVDGGRESRRSASGPARRTSISSSRRWRRRSPPARPRRQPPRRQREPPRRRPPRRRRSRATPATPKPAPAPVAPRAAAPPPLPPTPPAMPPGAPGTMVPGKP